MGLTSTSIGNKDSFLSHFGQFPPCCAMTSSGGLRSLPSYKMCLQPWQITRCGIQILNKYIDVAYLLVAKNFLLLPNGIYCKAFNGNYIGMLKCGLPAFGKIYFDHHGKA